MTAKYLQTDTLYKLPEGGGTEDRRLAAAKWLQHFAERDCKHLFPLELAYALLGNPTHVIGLLIEYRDGEAPEKAG